MTIKETIKRIIFENNDLYFPYFDDHFYILNTENKEKRISGMTLAVLLSYERDPSGSILFIRNGSSEQGAPDHYKIKIYLNSIGFDPLQLTSDITEVDLSDIDSFKKKTEGKNYSLIIVEDIDSYKDGDDAGKFEAVAALHAKRVLMTAGPDFDPGLEEDDGFDDYDSSKYEILKRGKYKDSICGEVYYNNRYTKYKGIINAVMDVLGLEKDDPFRKTLLDDDSAIYMTGDQLFSLSQQGDSSRILDNLTETWGDLFENYANNCEISDRKQLFIEFLKWAQQVTIISEGRYLINNYSIYDVLSITNEDRFMEVLGLVGFSDEDRERILANYEKYRD